MKGKLSKIVFYVAVFCAIIAMIYMFTTPKMVTTAKIYSDLQKEIKNENVKSLTITGNTAQAQLKNPDSTIEVEIPNMVVFNEDLGEDIRNQVEKGDLKYDTKAPETQPWWVSILPMLGSMLLLIFLYFFFMNRAQGGGKAMSFGKSKAKMLSDNKNKVLFSDVAGADEEKAELFEIVEFLKNPKKFTELGARIPRGVLLVGPPGTGKTLLAKAVAGEAKVPFFSISGSDFVEMFVGVGASRVRDLFEQAKKNSPSIVFIDEIDAVGRHRGAGLGGGHDEREQTLNQLLVEMDGFGDNMGVIVIAATNRPDILDPALLRPGRFDRQVVVGAPDAKGREEILKVHSKGKPLASDVDLSVVAKSTAGFTGADLANLMNEAALLAARNNEKQIHSKDLQDAMMKVAVGTEKKSRKISEHEKKLTAFHEAGHAVVSRFLPTQDPVHEVSIIPRGMAGGYTMHIPKEDIWYSSKKRMNEDIVALLGGRVAEKLTLNDISTGASNDIERATEIARSMVTQYGMSDVIGPIKYGSSQEVFLGKDFGHTRNYSENVAAQIDSEIKRIVCECFDRCEKILSENIDILNRVAEYLMENEKITGEEFDAIFNNKIDEYKQLVKTRKENEKREEEAAEARRIQQENEAKRPEFSVYADGKDSSESLNQMPADSFSTDTKDNDTDEKNKDEQ